MDGATDGTSGGTAGGRPDERSLDGWDVVARAAELARTGEPFALATVVWRAGPSSGHQGSRMIVTADGRQIGWIGGACAEPSVLRAMRQAIDEGTPRLLLLGDSEKFGGGLPDGMATVPVSCASEGALQVYVEPVVPAPHLLVVGRSPMAHTLGALAGALGWRTDVVAAEDLAADRVGASSVVVVATQGHGDEDVLETVVRARPAFVGLVASRRRGESVVGYLADRGLDRALLDRVRVPVGLDLGRTTHREIAVAVLAELVALRASGGLAPERPEGLPVVVQQRPAEAVDPVCGMTVTPGPAAYPYEHDGVTYHFCCAGCRTAFGKAPHDYLPEGSRC